MKKATPHFLFKTVLSLMLHLFSNSYAFSQDGLFPNRIGFSDENNRNVNHPDGTKLQDLKHAAGIFIKYLENKERTTACSSFTLLNNVKQDKKLYVSITSHSISDFEVGTTREDFFSFDFEMANALRRGNPTQDESISSIYKVKYNIVFKDPVSDLALIELKEYDPQLVQYAYAAGWNNTIEETLLGSNISHPLGDHKKVFTKPASIKMMNSKIFSVDSNTVFMYKSINNWNDTEAKIQQGSSGSGYFSEQNLLTAVFSQINNDKNIVRFSAISNSWYGMPAESSYFAKHLDPNNTWLNSIPGGYINDLVSMANNEKFELTMNPHEKITTPSYATNNPNALHDDVLWMNPNVIYFFKKNRKLGSFNPIWKDIIGIKAEKFSNSDSALVLSVYFLDQDPNTRLFSEKLIFATYIKRDSQLIEPTEFGFKGDDWDCESLSLNSPPCYRIPKRIAYRRTGTIIDVKSSYLEAAIKSNNGEFTPISLAKIPIVIRLDNLSSETVKVQTVSYPGDVPRNALQLFKPDEVANKFKSYKYKPSRGENSDELYLNTIKVELEQYVNVPDLGQCVALERRTLQEITTDNNGGYLNLVNPNYQIDDVVASEAGCPKNKLIITLNTSTTSNQYYGAWLDYHKVKKGGNNTNPADDYTYNFVDDTTQHPEEQLGMGNTTANTITIEHEIPYVSDLPFENSNEIKTHLRLAVAAQPQTGVFLKQDGIYNQGEVEDYLVSVRPSSDEDKRAAVERFTLADIVMEDVFEDESITCEDFNMENFFGIDQTIPQENLPIHGGLCSGIIDYTHSQVGKNAIDFNGQMYIGVAEGGNLVHNPSSKKTISIDFLKETIENNQDEILYEEGGSGQSGFSIRLKNGKIQFGVQIGNDLHTIESTSTIIPNMMTNVTAVFNEGKMELYVNGLLERNTHFSNQNTTIPEHLDDAGLGGVAGTTIWGSAIPNFDGIIDYFAYWNDALTATMIGILATRISSSNNNARIVDSNNKPERTIKKPEFSIFPNPATDELNILAEIQHSGYLKIEIFDLNGRKVYEMNKPNISIGHQLISLKNLKIASGKYIAKIQAGNVRRSEKVVFE